MDNLYLNNLVDNNQVFDKETKTFYNKLNKHINIFNNKLNNLRTQQYIIVYISLNTFVFMKF